MYYLGELARKPCTRQEVLGSNPAGCKNVFSVWDILVLPPGTKASSLLSRKANPGSKTETNGPVEPGQKAIFVVVVSYLLLLYLNLSYSKIIGITTSNQIL